MAKVTTSDRFDEFMDPQRYNRVIATALSVILKMYFRRYAKKDWAKKPWNTALSEPYRRWKTQTTRGRKAKPGRAWKRTTTGFRNTAGIADLFLTGKLRDEFLAMAPDRVTISVNPPRASTYISGERVPYAAAHQYGSGNTPRRQFIRLEAHEKDMARELRHLLVRHHAQGRRA